MPAQSETVLAELRQHLGIAPEEAALYFHLCMAGPSKASDVSEALKIHRNEVYRTAERLGARGLVRMTDDHPARYAAVDLAQVFDETLEARLKAIETLRRTRVEIEALVGAMGGGRPATQSTYKVLRGRREIYHVRQLMISGAQRSVDWVSTYGLALKLWEESGEWALVRRRAMAGLRFRALLPPSPALHAAAGELVDAPDAEMREFDAPGLVRFVMVDDRELLMFVVNDPNPSLNAEDEVAIHTTAPGFLYAQKVFFEQSWAAARPVGTPRADPLLSAGRARTRDTVIPREPVPLGGFETHGAPAQ